MFAIRRGFTLIELLIVIMVIGILAMIALPRFSRARERAYDAAAISDMRNLFTHCEAYFSLHLRYPASMSAIGNPSLSAGVEVTRFQRETNDGVEVVHIHLDHRNSRHYFHAEYPVEEIEMRNK